MGINHFNILKSKLGKEFLFKPKKSTAEAVGQNNVTIIGKASVNIKINELLFTNIKIDVLKSPSKYILLSNKHQTQLGITKDIKN